MYCLRFCAMLAICMAIGSTHLCSQQISPIANSVKQFRESGVRFDQLSLFFPVAQRESQAASAVPNAQFLTLDPDYIFSKNNSFSPALSLRLPFKDDVLILDLLEAPVTTQDFSALTSLSENSPVDYVPARHYRGVIRGDEHSIVALSLCQGEIMGIISNDHYGNLVLGKIDSPENQSEYVLYAENDLKAKIPFSCELLEPEERHEKPTSAGSPEVSGCVRVYFEADYELYQNKGSVQATIDYLTGAFNQVATLYANEQISTMLSEVFVWVTPDNYSTTSSSNALKEFRALRKNFNGDIAHLVGIGGNNLGGIAYLDVLCVPNYAYAFSDINTSYATVPTFSWTVEVLTHEMGHNLGSPHTQSCSWPGGAIDNCYSPEGNCSPGPAPTNGGTIMSYCHLTSYGINFNHGFGPLPGDKIRTEVANANCLSSSCAGTSSCQPPGGITVNNITTNSANVNWNAASNALSYTLQWRIVGNQNWTSINDVTSPYKLVNLSSGSNIEVRLQSHCSGGDSDFSQGVVFTVGGTGNASCDPPAKVTSTILSPNSVLLSWNSMPNATAYKLAFRKSSSSAWSATVNTGNTSYSLSGLDANTNYTVRVATVCDNNASNYVYATFTTPSGGSSASCGLPGNFSASNITNNSAQVSWNAVPGAVYYQLRYKKASSYYYGSAINLTSTSYTISGLLPNTSYHVLLRAVCNSSTSSYQTIQFTTDGGGTAGCTTPANFILKSVGASSAIISWDPVNAATGYDIQIKPPNYSYWLTFNNLPSNVIQITNMQPNSTYLVRVRSRCSGSFAFSPYTSILEINTLSNIQQDGEWAAIQPEAFAKIDLNDQLNSALEIAVFPNPTSGLFTVQFSPDTDNEPSVELFDPNGRQVEIQSNWQPESGQLQFDLSNQPAGVYFIRAILPDQAPAIRHLVKN